jgi:DNA polymerase-3 subunit beta
MRVTLERSNLLKSLNHVHRVVEKRNTIPILSNVLLRAEGGELQLKATDLDLEITEKTAAQVEEPGSTTVPAHTLYDIVRKLPDGSEVSLHVVDENNLKVSAGRSQFQLQILPESDFPDLTAGDFSHTFRIPAAVMKNLIDRTQFAISTEETRYYLNGIYFHTVESEGDLVMRAVATDGHRLARAEAEAPQGSEGMPGIIIPRKAVSEIQKLVEDPDGICTVELSDSKLRLSIDTIVLTTKLIDGTFPDYNRVIPDKNDRELKLNRAEFTAAVDRVSTVSTDRGRSVKLAISEGNLELSVNNPGSGSAQEEMNVDYKAEAMEIGFNSRYLLDISNQLIGEHTLFLLGDSGAPTLIQDEGHDSTIYVLMPMRV